LTIVLAGIQGHDIPEIAQLLKLPEGTVKSRLFHARERMKKSLRCIKEPDR
jgi:DNA-directed RNA polymerase specialized sigma24 family protein